ncbi:MAG TPA: hypothetical protein PKD45_00405 [Flavobacteriales bacterium]|nr:hypothetical protein [Flavobacteriales bacterium]
MNPRIAALPGLRRIATLAVILLFSGCLTIEEHYTFKKDGSGTMEYVMDLSEIGSLLESLPSDSGKKGGAKKDKASGEQVGILAGMEQQVPMLKELPGIKKVKLKKDKSGYLGRITFAFDDVAALNRALNVLMPDSVHGEQEFFRWEGSTLVRRSGGYARMLGSDMGADGDSLDVASMFESMKYKMSFKFAQPVSHLDKADGMVSGQPKPKQLNLATDFRKIMEDRSTLDLRIALDK